MPDAYQIETTTDHYLEEDSSGILLLENTLYIRDSFNRGNQANGGTADEGGTWKVDGSSSILSNKFRFTVGAAGTCNPNIVGSSLADFDAKVKIQASNVTSWDAEIRARYDNVNSYIRGTIDTSSTPDAIFLQHKLNGVTTDLATVNITNLIAATDYWMRMQAEGPTLRLKFWLASLQEPGPWDITATTVLLAPGLFGLDTFASTAVNIDWDDLNVGAIGVNDEMYMPYLGGGYGA